MISSDPEKIEEAARELVRYAQFLRSGQVDHTGCGLHRIVQDHLECLLGVRMINPSQYDDYVRLSDEDFVRRGGRRGS